MTSLNRDAPFRRTELWVYVILGLVLWQIPVFDRLHVESGAVGATVAFFLSGWAGARGGRLVPRMLWPLVLVGMLLVSLLWAPNCDILRGSGLFFVLVWPSVILGWAVGHWARSRSGRPVFWMFMVGGVVLVAGPLYDVGLHPQFYSYNHVFGAVLGPIYDEDLVVRAGLFVFRGMSLLWAAVFVAWARGRFGLMLIPGLLLGLLYAQPGRVGINTPEAWLQSRFTGHAQTAHFDVFYDTTAVPHAALGRILDDHEWHFDRLHRMTGVRPAGRVASYVYPDNATRAGLTGARTTSVAPVWLRTPQVHVSMASLASVFPHELAHVFSREFGTPVLRASPLVGLVEGFAVAVEPPGGGPSPEAMVLAAHPDASRRAAVAQEVARSLTPLGFWSGRAGVSYTWTGAFVHHLVETRGMDAFRRVYRSGDFMAVYGQSAEHLMASWVRDMPGFLASLPADARDTGQRRFGVLSLFEQSCPHWVPRPVRAYREAMANADTSGLRLVWQRWPEFHQARLGWASLVLPGTMPPLSGRPVHAQSVSAVLNGVPPSDRHATWHLFAGLAAANVAQASDSVGSAKARSLLLQALRRSLLSDRTLRYRALEGLDAITPGGLDGSLRDEWMRLQLYREVVDGTMDGDLDTAVHVGEGLVRQSRSVGDFGMAALGQEWLDRITWHRQHVSAHSTPR
ncbi:MAG: hypothetical protein RIE53_04575 [Rhodothermales bacterium]